MVFQYENMELVTVSEMLRGAVNDVLVCRDVNSPSGMCYTLLVIHDRACVKKMLAVMEEAERPGVEEKAFLFRFAQNEMLCFGFEYMPKRSLADFGVGQLQTPLAREQCCVNLVMACLSSPLPYPLLYLVLTQDNVQIEKDNSIYFTYFIDLAELEEGRSQSSCVTCCAYILLELLETAGNKQSLKSHELIWKKVLKGAYTAFPELYRDVKVTSLSDEKTGVLKRLRVWWLNHRDQGFRVLLGLCIAAVTVALVMLVSQILFGDIPLLRLFEASFEVIGTEVLR